MFPVKKLCSDNRPANDSLFLNFPWQDFRPGGKKRKMEGNIPNSYVLNLIKYIRISVVNSWMNFRHSYPYLSFTWMRMHGKLLIFFYILFIYLPRTLPFHFTDMRGWCIEKKSKYFTTLKIGASVCSGNIDVHGVLIENHFEFTMYSITT